MEQMRNLVPLLDKLGNLKMTDELNNTVDLLKLVCMNNNAIKRGKNMRTRTVSCTRDDVEIDIHISTFEEKEEPIDYDDAFVKFCFENVDKGIQELTALTYIKAVSVK